MDTLIFQTTIFFFSIIFLWLFWKATKIEQYRQVVVYTFLFMLGFGLFDPRINTWLSLNLGVNNIGHSVQMFILALALLKIEQSTAFYQQPKHNRSISKIWLASISFLTVPLIYVLSQLAIQDWDDLAQASLYLTFVTTFTISFSFYTCVRFLILYRDAFKYELSINTRTRYGISLITTFLSILTTILSFSRSVLLYTSGATTTLDKIDMLYATLFLLTILLWPFFFAPAWIINPISVQLDRFLKKRSIRQLSQINEDLSVFGQPYTHIESDDLDLMLQYTHNCICDLVVSAGKRNDEMAQLVHEILEPIGDITHPIKRMDFLKKNMVDARRIMSS